MILKNIDSKDEELNNLRSELKNAVSKKQEMFLKSKLNKIEFGYKNEKQNAYVLDSYLGNNKNLIVLHDLRLQVEDKYIQIDHLLISRVDITILESKSFSEEVFINEDGTLKVGKKAYASPLEQSKRQLHGLKSILNNAGLLENKIGKDIVLESVVLFSSNTMILNDKLPENYFRVDTYLKLREKEVDTMTFMKFVNLISGVKKLESIMNLAEFIKSKHIPRKINIENKIKKDKIIEQEVKKCDTKECSRCKEGHMVLRERKNKNYTDKYTNNKFYGCSRYPKCRNIEEILVES